ncbi:CAP domain-containing protein [Paenibacillus silvisoli]|uniref:CAP domain-containing protein n=1 Tax=Paenibacillus silvisoli TaxID=3110539 RepID=UPI0028039D5E|nr:CAP domain-containing protein [Paenibacillus silvisoli]
MRRFFGTLLGIVLAFGLGTLIYNAVSDNNVGPNNTYHSASRNDLKQDMRSLGHDARRGVRNLGNDVRRDLNPNYLGQDVRNFGNDVRRDLTFDRDRDGRLGMQSRDMLPFNSGHRTITPYNASGADAGNFGNLGNLRNIPWYQLYYGGTWNPYRGGQANPGTGGYPNTNNPPGTAAGNTEKPGNTGNVNAGGGSTSAETGTIQQQILQAVNAERAKAGLGALTLNASLSKVAQTKSQDMRDKNYFSHDSPTYGSPFDMMKQFGINYSYAGENIAAGQKGVQAVMTAWMNSPGHKANILSPNFTQLGVGYAPGGNMSPYWTQQFIKP